MPFPDNSGLITSLLQQFRHGLLSSIKFTGRIIGKPVFMAELPGQHTSPARPAERVRNKTVGKSHSIFRYAVEIRSLYIPCIITTHPLRRMIVGHNINDIQWFLSTLTRNETTQYSKRGRRVKKKLGLIDFISNGIILYNFI